MPLLLLDTDVEDNDAGRARRHRPAVRRRQRAPAAPGDPARHRRRARAARLLPATGARRPRCSTPTRATPGSSASSGSASCVAEHGPRRSTRPSRRSAPARVFTTHTPVPGRHRPLPARADRSSTSAADDALPGVPVDGCWRSAPRTTTARPERFNMAVMGLRLAQRANGVSKLHGEVSRAMFAGLWPGFDADEVPIGSVTNGVHAPTWVAREMHRPAPTPTVAGRPATARTAWDACHGARRRAVGGSSGCCGSGSSTTSARRLRAVVAAARGASGRARLDRRRARPRRADDRLRPAGRHLQAADADAARPGAAARRCCSTPSGRCSSCSPARPTRPTTAARS